MFINCCGVLVLLVVCVNMQAMVSNPEKSTRISLPKHIEQKFAQWLNAQKEADKIRKEFEVDKEILMLKVLPAPIRLSIIRSYFDEIKLLSQRYREELLPAVIPKPRNSRIVQQSRAEFEIKRGAKKCVEYFKNIPVDRKSIFPRFIHSIYFVPSCELDNPLFIKNENNDASITSPNLLLGGPLRANDYALVGWSDASQQIVLSTKNLSHLHDLSREQLMFIKNLYEVSYNLSDEEWLIFDSLPSVMKNNLTGYYITLKEYNREIRRIKESGEKV